MIKKEAFSVLEIILIILMAAIIGAAVIPLFNSTGISVKNTVDNKSIQDNINEQVNQIENIKKQNERMLENINQDY